MGGGATIASNVGIPTRRSEPNKAMQDEGGQRKRRHDRETIAEDNDMAHREGDTMRGGRCGIRRLGG